MRTVKVLLIYQGVSGHYKRGVTLQDAAGDNEYKDFQIRWGHKFSDKLAAKVNHMPSLKELIDS